MGISTTLRCCPDRPPYVMKLIRPLMPNRFLPQPAKYPYDFRVDLLPVVLLKKRKRDKSVKFATLQNRALYPCDATTPYGIFCPRMEKTLLKVVCDKCKKSFPSHAQILQHGRALHKLERAEILNMEDLLKIECDERLGEIVNIIHHNQTYKEYKCIFKNGNVS